MPGANCQLFVKDVLPVLSGGVRALHLDMTAISATIEALTMNFKPLANRVFIEPLEDEKTTKSGIVLPDTAEREKPIRGKVVAVGPGKLNEKGERTPMSVKVGDIVLFKKYGPDEIEIEGKKYLVGDEEDILAIIA